MVVNAIISTMVAHANKPCDNIIYHVGSSLENPVRYHNLQDYGFRYFKAKPYVNKEGNYVMVRKVTVLDSMASFQRYMFIRYFLPLKVVFKQSSMSTSYFPSIHAKCHPYDQVYSKQLYEERSNYFLKFLFGKC